MPCLLGRCTSCPRTPPNKFHHLEDQPIQKVGGRPLAGSGVKILPSTSRKLHQRSPCRGERSMCNPQSSSCDVYQSVQRRIVSISAGRHHLLALTSTGRTFAHPITKMANTNGQLGLRKFDIPGQSYDATLKSRQIVELIPKSILDPFAKASPFTRPSPSQVDPLANIDDQNIRFCDRLYEVPALRGVKVAQVAAGGRSSFVKTSTGQVLAWGANEYGCDFSWLICGPLSNASIPAK